MPSLSYKRYTRLKAEKGILFPTDEWTLKHRRHCFSHHIGELANVGSLPPLSA